MVLTAGFAVSGQAAILNVPCDFLSISNACATAQEGDVVWIQSGSCVISNQITISSGKSFTITGSGMNRTCLIGNTPTMLSVYNNSSNVFTVCNMMWVEPANASYFTIFGNQGYDSPGPYHVYNIQMTNVLSRAISMGFGKTYSSYGLIDHVYMASPVGSGSPQFIDFEGAFYNSWSSGIPFGTTKEVYVEDSYFTNYSRLGNGYFDAYNGAQLVFRHNYCDGYAPSGVHGYDSGQVSPRSWEIYNNVFTNAGANDMVIQLRGGSGVVFSNLVYGSNLKFCQLMYYRSCPIEHPYAGAPGGYLGTGVPGQIYDINFNGTPVDAGGGQTFTDGQPTNGQVLWLGFSRYEFTKSYYDSGHVAGFTGGYVVIGASVAETITNLMNCINLSATGRGITCSASTIIGTDFIATGCTATDLYLRNTLDGNTDEFGYPANQQPGVITSYPLTSTNFVNVQALWPCYSWSNLVNGSITDFTLANNDSICNYNITNLIKLNRDFFVSTVPSSAVYTPYVYPHPLQALESGGVGYSTPPPEGFGVATPQ